MWNYRCILNRRISCRKWSNYYMLLLLRYSSSTCPSTRSRRPYVRQIVFCLAQPMAMSLAVARSWGRAGSVRHGADQDSARPVGIAWCLFDATVTRFLFRLKIPTLTVMFILDRPTCVRNRLSAFQVVQGFSVLAGRCSSALIDPGVY